MGPIRWGPIELACAAEDLAVGGEAERADRAARLGAWGLLELQYSVVLRSIERGVPSGGDGGVWDASIYIAATACARVASSITRLGAPDL